MPTNTEAAIEDLKKLGIKALGSQLKDLATEILKLLSQAQREASQPDQRSKGALEWTTVLTHSVRNYQNQLVASIAERDPRAMSIRRKCLDHVIVCNETSLRRILRAYFSYYHTTRPHMSLAKDSPEPREVHPPELGRVISIPQVGGLHHRYERRAA